MSEDTTRRRWFRFSLRALFVVVTVVGVTLGWLVWNLKAVRERAALRQSLAARGVLAEHIDLPGNPPGNIPLAWRLLGVKPEYFNSLVLPVEEFTEDERNRVIASFPEVIRWRTSQRTEPTLFREF